MLQLILMRHAKATPAEEADDDFARALAPRGREDAQVIGQALKDAGADPLIVLVSEAKRTRETWELAGAAFPKAQVKFLRSLYLCTAETLMYEAEKAGAERVMVVAHNPGLHELAARLAHRNNDLETKLRARFPTAAAALFARKDRDASWKLQDYFTPKMMSD